MKNTIQDKTKLVNSVFSKVYKKYDLMRTNLWIDSIKVKEECTRVDSVVYFYEYGTEVIASKAKQSVWSKVLVDLKNEKADKILLIPPKKPRKYSQLLLTFR